MQRLPGALRSGGVTPPPRTHHLAASTLCIQGEDLAGTYAVSRIFLRCLSWAVYFSTYNTWTFASVLTIISRSLLGGDARTKTTFFQEYLSLASEAAVGVKNGAIQAPPPGPATPVRLCLSGTVDAT